jgi:hypothetical protein
MRPGTTHGELMLYVIEHRLSCEQHRSCDLNQLLTLRGLTRSTDGGELP